MQRAPDHAVPAGPLGVRWLGHELGALQAGARSTARVELENAGAAQWHDVALSYHWLDDLGNPIIWDGLRATLPPPAPGGGASAGPPLRGGRPPPPARGGRRRATAALPLRGWIPPGAYRLALDLVLEHRYWLSEIGNEM